MPVRDCAATCRDGRACAAMSGHVRGCEVGRFLRVLDPQQHRYGHEDELEAMKQIYKLAALFRDHNGTVCVGLEVDMNPLFALAPPAYRVHERVPDEVRGLAFRALDADRAQREVRIVCRQL